MPLPPQRLLEAEQIPHKVKPVSDYRNLGDIYVEQIASSTEVCLAPPPPYVANMFVCDGTRLRPAPPPPPLGGESLAF